MQCSGIVKRRSNKINMRNIIYMCCLLLVFASCKKSREQFAAPGTLVEIYVVKPAGLMGVTCGVSTNMGVLPLESSPVITNDQFIWYNRSNGRFKFSHTAFDTLKNRPNMTVLAVTVDKKIIYYFVTRTLTSSLVCPQSITMTPELPLDDIMRMELTGMPLYSSMSSAPDERNNALLIATFNAQGKLQ